MPNAPVAATQKGKFTITGLPPGKRVFRVWQEKSGWLDRGLKVTVRRGETTDLGEIHVPAGKFDD